MISERQKRRERLLLKLHSFFRKYRQTSYVGKTIGFIYGDMIKIYAFLLYLVLTAREAIDSKIKTIITKEIKSKNLEFDLEIFARKNFLRSERGRDERLLRLSRKLEKILGKVRSLSDRKVISTQFKEDHKTIKYKISSSPIKLERLKIIKTCVNRAIRFLKEDIELFHLAIVQKNDDFFPKKLSIFNSFLRKKILDHLLNIPSEYRKRLIKFVIM